MHAGTAHIRQQCGGSVWSEMHMQRATGQVICTRSILCRQLWH